MDQSHNLDHIQELIDAGKWADMRPVLLQMSTPELVELISDLQKPYECVVFRLLPREEAIAVFSDLSPDDQEDLLNQLSAKETRGLLADLKPDNRTELFEEMPGEVTRRLMRLLSPEDLRETRQLLGYPEDSAGRLMTPEYLSIAHTASIADVLVTLRQHGKDTETINYLYVVDDHAHLIGVISIRDVILAEPHENICQVMTEEVIAAPAKEDREVVARMMQDHDLEVLPVVDSQNVLLGIVTVDDVLDVAEEEATEDFHKFGSIQHAVFNPLEASIGFLYKKRIVWLFTLVFMNIFSGAALAMFEKTIQSVVTLVFFLPLLIGSGGNAGSQSATLMVRALATGDVRLSDWLKLFAKELVVALLLGGTMAIGVGLIAGYRAPEILLVVSTTMIAVVTVGSLVGMTLPFVFTKFGIDPATASTPLIASIADISGIVIYFSIASWYLHLSG